MDDLLTYLHLVEDKTKIFMIMCSSLTKNVTHPGHLTHTHTPPQGNNMLSVSAKGTDSQLISNLLDELKALV